MGKIPQTHRKHTHPADTCTQADVWCVSLRADTHTLGTDKHTQISQQINASDWMCACTIYIQTITDLVIPSYIYSLLTKNNFGPGADMLRKTAEHKLSLRSASPARNSSAVSG